MSIFRTLRNAATVNFYDSLDWSRGSLRQEPATFFGAKCRYILEDSLYLGDNLTKGKKARSVTVYTEHDLKAPEEQQVRKQARRAVRVGTLVHTLVTGLIFAGGYAYAVARGMTAATSLTFGAAVAALPIAMFAAPFFMILKAACSSSFRKNATMYSNPRKT